MENEANKQTEMPDWLHTKTIEPTDYWAPAPGDHRVVVLGETIKNVERTDEANQPYNQPTLYLTIEVLPGPTKKVWTIDWKDEFGPAGKLGQLKKIVLTKKSQNLIGSVLRVIIVGEGKNRRYTIIDETPKPA
jgi:hypothetical protein